MQHLIAADAENVQMGPYPITIAQNFWGMAIAIIT
jgi:hypothetical protein